MAILVTVLAWLGYLAFTVLRGALGFGDAADPLTAEAASLPLAVSLLAFGALVGLVARQEALYRFRDHVRVPHAVLDGHFGARQGALTVLVPSCGDRAGTVRATLWSAALQEYPSLRVVLLLDDPLAPVQPGAVALLAESRAVTRQISDALAEPRLRFSDELLICELELGANPTVTESAVRELAANYRWATEWLRRAARTESRSDDVDGRLLGRTLRALSARLANTERRISRAADSHALPSPREMLELHRRLVWTFSAELETFERRRYPALSHEPGKASNLNTYIALMGKRFRCVEGSNGTDLQPIDLMPFDPQSGAVRPAGVHPGVAGQEADLLVPDADYLLTLDTASLVLSDYCLRLVYFLEQPNNARVAVAQTPHSAAAGARLQHLAHGVSSYYGASFWVGATAVIRKRALRDIDEAARMPVPREPRRAPHTDTTASIALGTHGWTLANYPERLSFSVVPPARGSVVVQTRHWGAAAWLLAPKLLRT